MCRYKRLKQFSRVLSHALHVSGRKQNKRSKEAHCFRGFPGLFEFDDRLMGGSMLISLIYFKRLSTKELTKINWPNKGGSRIFFRRGCTRLLLYLVFFFFFFGRILVVLENRRSSWGGRGAHPLHPPPRFAPAEDHIQP